MDIELTDHAFDRLKERNNWSRNTAKRMVQKIFEAGKDISRLNGCIKTWYDHRSDRDDDTLYLLYGTNIYVFRDNALITAFPMPNFKNKNIARRHREQWGRAYKAASPAEVYEEVS